MALKFKEYDYEILYKHCNINKNADVISRIKINHFKCSDLHSIILATNETSDNEIETEIDFQKLT